MHTADVKYRAIVHYTHFCRSLRSVAKLYKVGKSTLARWVTASRRTDAAQMKHVRVACTRRRHAARLAVMEDVKAVLQSNPFSNMAAVVQHIKTSCGVVISPSTASRLVRDAGYTRKKAFRCSSQPCNKERVLRFCNAYQGNADNIVCVDEACFFHGEHPRRGYSPKGKRLHVACNPLLRRRKITLIMAIGRQGIIHYDVSEDNCNKSRFVAFVNQLPCPPGTVILMDNVAFHRSTESRHALEARGFQELFIPPYSPRLNAIENVFSAVKQTYRSHCPCTFDASFDYVSLMIGVLACFGTCQAYFRRVDALVEETLADGAVSFRGVDA